MKSSCSPLNYRFRAWFHPKKRVRHMIRTYSQMLRIDKYSKTQFHHLASLSNGRVFVYELSACAFESSCSLLNSRFSACFEQGVPWHSGNYRVWIHSKTRTWHDKNIQSDTFRSVKYPRRGTSEWVWVVFDF